MCRYLYYVHGASTTSIAKKYRTSEIGREGEPPFWRPMYAALYEKQYEVAKWLYKHAGAKKEIFERVGRFRGGTIPFSMTLDHAADEFGDEGAAVEFLKWAIRQGALRLVSLDVQNNSLQKLFLNDFQTFETDHYTNIVTKEVTWDQIKHYYITWANDLIRSNKAFRIFLLGTWRAPDYSVAEIKKLLVQKTGNSFASSVLVDCAVEQGFGRAVWDSFMEKCRAPARNQCLGPFPGVLERIAEFVGVVKSNRERWNVDHFRWIVKKLER